MSFFCHKKRTGRKKKYDNNMTDKICFCPCNSLWDNVSFLLYIDAQKNRHLFVTHVVCSIQPKWPIYWTEIVQKNGHRCTL